MVTILTMVNDFLFPTIGLEGPRVYMLTMMYNFLFPTIGLEGPRVYMFPAVMLECPVGFCFVPARGLEDPRGVSFLIFPERLVRGQV